MWTRRWPDRCPRKPGGNCCEYALPARTALGTAHHQRRSIPSGSAHYRGRSVVFCTLSDDPREGFYREYTMQDVTLANHLADYMSNLKDSSLVRTQRYTLEYIDLCLRPL